ncbi:MAG: hypothetical protein WC686_02955 [Candidatus Shapirobacteria bacterium]
MTVFVVMMSVSHIVSIAVHRAFYADGPYFFLKCLMDGFFIDWQRQRLFITVINELPLFVASRLHLRSYVWLSYFFSWPLFFFPLLLVIISSLLLHRKTGIKNLPIFIYLFFATPSLIFAINQAFLYLGLTVVSVSTFLAKKRLTKANKIGLVAAALIMTYGHETALLTFPVFFVYCIYRRWKKESGNYLIVLAIIYLLGFIFSFIWTTSAKSGNNLYIIVLRDIVLHSRFYLEETSLLYVVAGISFLTINYFLSFISNDKNRKIVSGVKAGLIIILVVLLSRQAINMIFFKQVVGWYDFGLRILLLVGSVVASLCLLVPKKIITGILEGRAVLMTLIIITIFSSIWQFNHSIRWKRFLDSAEKYVNELSYSERADAEKIYQGYDADWPWPALSIFIQKGKVKVVVLPIRKEFDQYIQIPGKSGDRLAIPFSVINEGEFFDLSNFHYQKDPHSEVK